MGRKGCFECCEAAYWFRINQTGWDRAIDPSLVAKLYVFIAILSIHCNFNLHTTYLETMQVSWCESIVQCCYCVPAAPTADKHKPLLAFITRRRGLQNVFFLALVSPCLFSFRCSHSLPVHHVPSFPRLLRGLSSCNTLLISLSLVSVYQRAVVLVKRSLDWTASCDFMIIYAISLTTISLLCLNH